MATRAKKKKDYPLLDRDISWMYFNHRILEEARRPELPLMERLSFIGIYSNNLDEFFRVRVAVQKRLAESDALSEKERRHAREVIKRVNQLNRVYSCGFEETVAELTAELRREHIRLIDDSEVTDAQREHIHRFFYEKLLGSTVPLMLSKISRLGNETDDVIYLAVRMSRWLPEQAKAKKDYALLRVPVRKLGRFYRLPDDEDGATLMYLDDVIRVCLPLFFAGLGYSAFEAYAFKFTKDAEMELEHDLSSSKLQKVQKGLRSRKRGVPMRVLYDESMPHDILKRLCAKLQLDSSDTLLARGRYHNHKDWMSLPDCGRKDLKYPAWPPLQHPAFLGGRSVLESIREQDRLLHVPYQSFDAYLRFLGEAAVCPDVTGIQTTLYRLAKDSKVVETLIAAAKNGKKVSVVIELLARFDEESNIEWSKKMQDAGVQVIFGVDGLKVHSKLTLVESRRGNIACIGTGNFHEGNARIYTDCMLFTAGKDMLRDVAQVFAFIRSPYIPAKFRHLLVSPNHMKDRILRLIRNEIANRRIGRDAFIRVKINHITDPDVLAQLYAAAAEGVKVDLLLRGNCSLVPDDPQIAANMRIHGIIDRYLEHSRILIFCNGGDVKYYLGSADWMPRNLENRIEVMAPVYRPELQEELARIVDFGLRDTLQGRVVDGHGSAMLWGEICPEAPKFRSQEALYRYYAQKAEEEEKLPETH